MRSIITSILLIYFSSNLFAVEKLKEIQTNQIIFHNPPKWVTAVRLEKLADKVQDKLEWSTRRVNVYYHDTEEAFRNSHKLGPQARAVTLKSPEKQEIQLSPRINDKNFDEVLKHELVHVIFYQKYKSAIPKWLEEGFANFLSASKKVDYKWLAKKPFPEDITKMAHPFSKDESYIFYHYAASQATVEMLKKKCDLENLLRLSVGQNMSTYINTYCEIKDLNKAFKEWVISNSKKG